MATKLLMDEFKQAIMYADLASGRALTITKLLEYTTFIANNVIEDYERYLHYLAKQLTTNEWASIGRKEVLKCSLILGHYL